MSSPSMGVMNFFRIFRTVKHLRFRQILCRVYLRIKYVRVGRVESSSLAQKANPWINASYKQGTFMGPYRLIVLAQEIDVASKSGWAPSTTDKLLIYNLHYLDIINSQSGQDNSHLSQDLINSWITQNRPLKGAGWEPYPLSLRIVNLIKWHLQGHPLDPRATESLFLQARILSQRLEYHLLANHLFANAKALYFAGLFFNGNEALRWYRKSVRILRHELTEQILSDGGHFELSPMYHSIIAEDVLDLVNLAQTYNDHSLPNLHEVANKMLRWLVVMSHPDQNVSYFNDSSARNAVPLHDLRSYADRLGINTPDLCTDRFTHLEASGYTRYQDNHATLLIDVGPIGPSYNPGHGHCDLLSFELSLGQKRYLVNTGISTYNVCDKRLYERSTEAHNTVSISNHEQSEIWSSFRVGRRAKPQLIHIDENFIEASHDGYCESGILHRRQFLFSQGQILIRDFLDSGYSCNGTAHFHIHPDLNPYLCDDTVSIDGLTIRFENASRIELKPYEYCLGFNERLNAFKAEVSFKDSLSTSLDYTSLAGEFIESD